MKYGLAKNEFNLLNEILIEPLKKHGARVFLFGSRATGKQKQFSDVDLLYIQDPKLPIPGHVIFSLLTEIEESRFLFKVDLVNANELARSYRDNVEKEKKEL